MKLKLGKKDPSSNLCRELCAEEIHEGYFFIQGSEHFYIYHNNKEYYYLVYHYNKDRNTLIIHHANSKPQINFIGEYRNYSFSVMIDIVEIAVNEDILFRSKGYI